MVDLEHGLAALPPVLQVGLQVLERRRVEGEVVDPPGEAERAVEVGREVVPDVVVVQLPEGDHPVGARVVEEVLRPAALVAGRRGGHDLDQLEAHDPRVEVVRGRGVLRGQCHVVEAHEIPLRTDGRQGSSIAPGRPGGHLLGSPGGVPVQLLTRRVGAGRHRHHVGLHRADRAPDRPLGRGHRGRSLLARRGRHRPRAARRVLADRRPAAPTRATRADRGVRRGAGRPLAAPGRRAAAGAARHGDAPHVPVAGAGGRAGPAGAGRDRGAHHQGGAGHGPRRPGPAGPARAGRPRRRAARHRRRRRVRGLDAAQQAGGRRHRRVLARLLQPGHRRVGAGAVGACGPTGATLGSRGRGSWSSASA